MRRRSQIGLALSVVALLLAWLFWREGPGPRRAATAEAAPAPARRLAGGKRVDVGSSEAPAPTPRRPEGPPAPLELRLLRAGTNEPLADYAVRVELPEGGPSETLVTDPAGRARTREPLRTGLVRLVLLDHPLAESLPDCGAPEVRLLEHAGPAVREIEVVAGPRYALALSGTPLPAEEHVAHTELLPSLRTSPWFAGLAERAAPPRDCSLLRAGPTPWVRLAETIESETDRWLVVRSRDGFWEGARRVPARPTPETPVLPLELSRRGRLVLEVRTAENAPAAGVRLEGTPPGRLPSAYPQPVETDAEGRAELLWLEPGTWRFVARHPRFEERVSEVEIEAGREVRHVLRLVSLPAGPIAGVVVAEGPPLPEALTLTLESTDGAGRRFSLDLAPPAGSRQVPFRFDDVPLGEYALCGADATRRAYAVPPERVRPPLVGVTVRATDRRLVRVELAVTAYLELEFDVRRPLRLFDVSVEVGGLVVDRAEIEPAAVARLAFDAPEGAPLAFTVRARGCRPFEGGWDDLVGDGATRYGTIRLEAE